VNLNSLVSIIIPTYNRAHLIGETLDSVLAQTYQNWECIIVDDGSTDNTNEVVGKYLNKDNRFKYYHRPDEHLPGGNGARNYGFKMSQGEYVNWFDDDDLMHKDKLTIQIKLLQKTNKNFCVCQTLIFEKNLKNIIGLRKEKIISNDPFNDYIQSNIKWLTQSPVFKSSFLRKHDLSFFEQLKKSQEYEFFARVLNIEPNYVVTEKPLVFLRKHKHRISSIRYSNDKNNSIFLSSQKIFVENLKKLNEKSQAVLLNSMLSSIFKAMHNKDFESAKILINKFKKMKTLKLRETVLLKVSEFSYKITGKGYVFFNLLKYA